MLALYMALIDEENDKLIFKDIYDQYERKLFAHSMSILHNKMLAEDAVSETFLALTRNFQKVHNLEPAEIVAYTVIINRNVCYDILKKEKKHDQSVVTDEFIESKPDTSADERLENIIVADMVEKLPEIYRDVIMMKYFYGFSVKEISSQLHLSVGGVKSRLETARVLLRKEIGQNV